MLDRAAESMKPFTFLALLALLLAPVTAPADIGNERAIAIAQGVYPGRVLSVKRVKESGTPAYRVKTLSADGDVRIILIDAESGSVISP